MNLSAIMTFLSRLSKRERLVFYGTVFFISAALADRLLLGPILFKIRQLDERIHSQEETAKKNARIVAEKEKIRAALAEVSTFSRKTQSQEEEVALLLGEVEKLGRKVSLYIVDMKPIGVQEDAISRRYSMDLNGEAQMEQLFSFMVELESSPMLFVVDSFTIAPKSKDSSIAKVNMKISSVVFL